MRALALCAALASPAGAQEILLVQSTTSTEASGFYDHILPLAEAALNLDIRVVAVGTGQALDNARRCDGDMTITHAPAAEAEFVAAGYGLTPHPIMVNDFVVVGPLEDPAGVGTAATAQAAFARIAQAGAPFVSRGDDSGTHRREREIWPGGVPRDAWYLETGSGMGATLQIAANLEAYTLVDRATYATFTGAGTLAILFEGTADLRNPYAAIVVDPAHCPRTATAAATAFVEWLISDAGQSAIAAFRPTGAPLFLPDARPPN